MGSNGGVRVTVSKETHDLFRRHVLPGRELRTSDETTTDDGMISFEIDHEVAGRIRVLYPTETWEEILQMLLSVKQ